MIIIPFYVYKITNSINNKIYVGQTTETLKQRFSRHIGYQLRDSNYKSKIHRAMIKYGVENFSIELLEEVSNQDELNEREYYWIHKLDTIKNGYNINDSGKKCGGDTLSNNPNLKEISKKISKTKRGSLNPQAKKILVENIETNKKFIFNCVEDFVRKYNFKSHSQIAKLARENKKNNSKKLYKKCWFIKYIE